MMQRPKGEFEIHMKVTNDSINTSIVGNSNNLERVLTIAILMEKLELQKEEVAALVLYWKENLGAQCVDTNRVRYYLEALDINMQEDQNDC